MSKNIHTNHVIMAFLISAILACVSSIIAANIGFHLLSHSLRVQGVILGLGWSAFTVIYFLTIRSLLLRFEMVRNWFSFDLNFGTIVRRGFLAIFLLFPMSLILYENLHLFLTKFPAILGGETKRNWQSLTADLLFFIFTVLLFFLAVFFLMKLKKSANQMFNKWPDYYYVFAIFIFSVGVRLFFISHINTQPESDFLVINNDALRIAEGKNPAAIYVTTHVAITLIYGGLYKLFGTDLVVLKFFHAFVYSLSGVLIYFVGKQVFNSKLWGWIAGTLLVLWPSLAIYSNVLTPEHVFILAECAFLLVAVKLFGNHSEIETSQIKTGRQVLLFCTTGIFLGMMGLFRPFDLLFLIALVIILLVYRKNISFYVYVLGLAALLIPYAMLSKLPGTVAEYYHQNIPNIRPCNLLVGMSIESNGQWNLNDYYLCRNIRENSADSSEYMSGVMQIVRERFIPRQAELFPFLEKKFSILWGDSYGIMAWSTQPVADGVSGEMINLALNLSLVELAVTLLLLVACLLAVILSLFQDIKAIPFLVMMAFFGFHLMEVPFEVQTRYRTVVIPMLILLACWAFVTLSSSYQKKQPAHPEDIETDATDNAGTAI